MISQSRSHILRSTSIVREYLILMKPELTLLSVLTAVGAAYLASRELLHLMPIVHTAVGTFLVGGGAGTLNQYLERDHDALMKRTMRRPLPAGIIDPQDALLFGIILSAIGMMYLAATTTMAAAMLSLLTLVSYVFIYTPLKRRTPFAIVVGGLPGALPPLIGWAAVRGGLSIEAWSLFFIVFFWQMPHFLSLAWMYKKDYEHAGFKTLTVLDPAGSVTSRQMLVYSLVLIPASVFPTFIGLTGKIYFFAAFAFSCAFVVAALHFAVKRTAASARLVFLASLLYLPLEFVFLLANR